jgi:D-alanyl-D-alanine-carboxypeptidase/D-alanyl-D-alanine-endopeptidase
VAGTIYQQGDVAAGAEQLAMNFLLDRDAAAWARYIANLKKQVGDCDTAEPISANSALSGEFTWRCVHGRLAGSITLAPTRPPRIQELDLNRKTP